MSKTKTILDVQAEVEAALKMLSQMAAQLPDPLKPLVRLAPLEGCQARVSLRHAETDRQVRRNAPADSWSPESGLVTISYEPAAASRMDLPQAEAPVVSPERRPSDDPVRDLILALARAEREPNRNFVALKWFRDAYLPQQGYGWASVQDLRHQAIVEADRRRLILTYKVPNPKNPQFPVTAIRLNRPMTEVRQVLDQEPGLASDFAPIPIRGEHLSQTVLRERR